MAQVFTKRSTNSASIPAAIWEDDNALKSACEAAEAPPHNFSLKAPQCSSEGGEHRGGIDL